MVPKCVVCGFSMKLDDKDRDGDIINTFWLCQYCKNVGMHIEYNMKTGYRSINADIEELPKEVENDRSKK